MAFAQDSQASQKGKEEKFKRGGLNRGRSERYEDTIEYYEQKLSKAKEIGDVKETCETYEVLATAYAAVWNQEDRSHKRRSKHGRNVNSERSLNKGRTERYNIKLDYFNEILKKGNETPGNELEKYTTYEGLTKTYRAMAIPGNKIVEKGNGNNNLRTASRAFFIERERREEDSCMYSCLASVRLMAVAWIHSRGLKSIH